MEDTKIYEKNRDRFLDVIKQVKLEERELAMLSECIRTYREITSDIFMCCVMDVVDSLGGYMDIIGQIAVDKGKYQNKDFVSVLWFRGMSDIGHSLVTTMHRSGVVVDRHGKGSNYSQAHYDEDICAQHYSGQRGGAEPRNDVGISGGNLWYMDIKELRYSMSKDEKG